MKKMLILFFVYLTLISTLYFAIQFFVYPKEIIKPAPTNKATFSDVYEVVPVTVEFADI